MTARARPLSLVPNQGALKQEVAVVVVAVLEVDAKREDAGDKLHREPPVAGASSRSSRVNLAKDVAIMAAGHRREAAVVAARSTERAA